MRGAVQKKVLGRAVTAPAGSCEVGSTATAFGVIELTMGPTVAEHTQLGNFVYLSLTACRWRSQVRRYPSIADGPSRYSGFDASRSAPLA